MGEADFSERSTSKPREDLPYDEGFSQTQLYDNDNFSLENDVSDQVVSAAEDTQKKVPHGGTCRNAGMVPTLGKMTENAVKKNHGREPWGAAELRGPPNKGDLAKPNISDILQHRLSKEEPVRGQGIHCETLPETSSADSFDGTMVRSIILRYMTSSWPKEQGPELPDQPDPKRAGGGGSPAGCSPATTGGKPSDFQEPVAAGSGGQPDSLDSLTETKTPSHKLEGCHGQTRQNGQTKKTRWGRGCQYDRVRYRLSGFSSAASEVQAPSDGGTDKPRPASQQTRVPPELRDRLALVRDIFRSLSESKSVEKEEQTEASDPLQWTGMEPTAHTHQDHLTGTESETTLFKLSSTSWKDPSSSSYIFQKISQETKMCQKLKEQTDQLKTKVQEFFKSIAQDPPCHVQDKRLVLEELRAHPELLEQEFVAEGQRPTLEQVHKHESQDASAFDPERKVEGEISKLERRLEDIRESKEGGHTAASSLPVSAPAAWPACQPQSLHPRMRKQSMEKKGHRRTSYLFPTALPEKAPHPDSTLSPNPGLSCCSTPDTGRQSSKWVTCGRKRPDSPRSHRKDAEFHYRYNTLGEDCFYHKGGSAFTQLCFPSENKNSSPSCSKPNWIHSQRGNSKSLQDEHEPTPGKENLLAFVACSSDLATSSARFHSCRISGSKPSSNCFGSIEETKAEGLNSALDHALRTATALKETTDQMIRTIAGDLAEVRRRRNQLKEFGAREASTHSGHLRTGFPAPKVGSAGRGIESIPTLKVSAVTTVLLFT